jgi:hypothetical protein
MSGAEDLYLVGSRKRHSLMYSRMLYRSARPCLGLIWTLSDFAARDTPTYQDYQSDPEAYQRKTAVLRLIHHEKPVKKLEGYFSVAKVDATALWVKSEDVNSDKKGDPDMKRGAKLGPIQVPGPALKLAKVADQISGLLAQMNGYWKWLEVWNVYPG